jgi:hypothetical protein
MVKIITLQVINIGSTPIASNTVISKSVPVSGSVYVFYKCYLI